jgi:hypothetical protein
MGYLHVKVGDGPLDFHGRFKKQGGILEDTENPNWQLIGEARSRSSVPADGKILFEVLAEEARDLSPLARLRPDDLAAIWLGNTHVNDEQLRHLSHLTGLVWLDVQNNNAITDAGIAHLAHLTSLQSFGAHWTRISAASLLQLAQCRRLTYVDVWGCDIPAEAVANFKKALPLCQVRTE